MPGPYRLAACKAVGWVIPEYDRAQVSMNLVNTAVTKPHQAFEACRQAPATAASASPAASWSA